MFWGDNRPISTNFTEGATAVFKCHADANPPAVVKWYINGNETLGMYWHDLNIFIDIYIPYLLISTFLKAIIQMDTSKKVMNGIWRMNDVVPSHSKACP